jgi:lysyl-tRNA synthetase class 2
MVDQNMTAASTAKAISNPLSEFQERKRKLEELRAAGVMPYPERYKRTHTTSQARALAQKNPPRKLEEILAPLSAASLGHDNNGSALSKEAAANKSSVKIRLAGRVMLIRPHGKLTFAQLQDDSGQIQICFMQTFMEAFGKFAAGPRKKPFKGLQSYKMVRKLDMADFVGVSGELFHTRHGELTLLVKEWTFLGKTLRPLPEKFHGLQDLEAKYRYRYLDLLADPSAKKRFVTRTRLVAAMRRFMDKHGFLEVETPILTSVPSGAAAKPFCTHHNALDIDLFLRIAPETYLKRCIVGGFERVYEIGKCFRNEGMDPSHLQEFTMMEYYAAYWNYEDNMDFTEKFISHLIKELTGGTTISAKDRDGKTQTINFKTPWPRLNFAEIIKQDCGIDILEHYGDADSLRAAISSKLGSSFKLERAETMGYGNLCDALYKKVSRPKLIQPAFVIKHPVDTKPLARRNDKDERIADTFQLLVNTWEIVNAYSELVDPIDQRSRLQKQATARAQGDEEAMPMDEDYLLAMEHGMPPISGWGLGIDRFMALLTGQDNLKDVVLFPLMKPAD